MQQFYFYVIVHGINHFILVKYLDTPITNDYKNKLYF